MIYFGDEKGKVFSYKIVSKDDKFTDFKLLTEFKDFSKPIKALSLTLDHQLLSVVETDGKCC